MRWMSWSLLLCTAHAGEWSKQPIEPKARPGGTAFTVGKNTLQLGLVHQRFGLLDNLHVGTTGPLWLLGVPNGDAKVTAIQTPRFDVALDGAVFFYDLDALGVPNGDLWVTPIGWTASWTISDHVSLHGGTAWTLARASGQLQSAQLADGIEQLTGADIGADLEAVLGSGGGVYGGANLSLLQTRLGAELRMNRRDSLILQSNTWVLASGLVAAGVQADDVGGDVDVEAGASARFTVPLRESIPTLTTLSWQFSWRRAHLRLGIPLPLDNTFAWFQAVDFYALFGPSPKATPPVPAPSTAVDTGAPEAPAVDTGRDEPPTVDTGTPDPPASDTGRP